VYLPALAAFAASTATSAVVSIVFLIQIPGSAHGQEYDDVREKQPEDIDGDDATDGLADEFIGVIRH
jgi:hypothetical protein